MKWLALTMLLVPSTTAAQWTFDTNSGRAGSGDLVVIVSAAEDATLAEDAPEATRILVESIRNLSRSPFPYIRYVDGPWQDSRAMTPDVIIVWGAPRNTCRIGRWGRTRYIEFGAAGSPRQIHTRILEGLVPCIRRHARRVR
jgi:hypothetical protein